MGQAAHGKNIMCALVLAMGMSLLFPEAASSASRSFRRSGKSRGAAVHSVHNFADPFRSGFGFVLEPARGRHRFTDRFDRSGFHSGFGGVVGLGGDDGGVVIIQQFQSSTPNPSREPAGTGTYIYPQWVDGGHGVEVLRPGYWSDANTPAQR
jgi:hypothetical protein